MAIGVAFGSIAYGIEGATVMAAVMLAIGIWVILGMYQENTIFCKKEKCQFLLTK